jgi:hypothetical protein
VLALPLIGMHPNHMAVGAMKLGVDVQHRLRVVVAGWDVREVVEREAEHMWADRCRRARLQRVDVNAIEGHAAAVASGLKARLTSVCTAENDENAPCGGGARDRWVESDGYLLRLGGSRGERRDEDRTGEGSNVTHGCSFCGLWPIFNMGSARFPRETCNRQPTISEARKRRVGVTH